MPCRSDYMEPTARETESKRVAKHIIYLYTKLDIVKHIPQTVHDAAKNTYGDANRCDEFTKLLCGTIQGYPIHDVHAIIYNGRDAEARKLADWWDEHQIVDKRREKEEAKEAERQAVLDSLTPYQRAVLFPGE